MESPKTRALKSKLQAKPAKQASPKSARKEQAKAQSKIARTKGPEKLSYSPSPIDDAKTGSKIANAGTKLVGCDKKVNNFDLLKQSPQLQKSNLTLASPVHQKSQQIVQEPRIVGGTKPEQKSIQRPKMELPGKINDPKINPQNLKGPPNGLSKDVLAQKGLLTNSNGLIKQSSLEENPMMENGPVKFDKTITTMNQANINILDDKIVSPVQKTVDVDLNNFKCSEDNYEVHGKSCDNHISDQNQESSTDNKMHGKIVESPLPGPPNNSQGQSATAPGMSPGSSIPKPTALVKGTTKQQKEINVPNIPSATKLKSDLLHRKLDPNTVAMVSPMPSISDLMSESSHSNSNSTGQSNSSDSSVIYRPSSESGSEIKTIPNRKIDTTFEQMEKVSQISFACSKGWGSTFRTTKCRMTNISKFRHFEY